MVCGLRVRLEGAIGVDERRGLTENYVTTYEVHLGRRLNSPETKNKTLIHDLSKC